MSKYWQDRMAAAQNERTNKSIKEVEEQLTKYYQKTMDSVIKEFENTYVKLVEQSIEGQAPTPALLYKLDSYWKMQAQLQVELEKLGDKQVRALSRDFIEQYIDIYKSIALPGEAAFSTIDTSTVEQMINQIWCADGKTWSNRIWTNTGKLKEALNDGLIACVVSGKKSADLRKLLIKEFEIAYNRADSIVRTEMAHIQTQAAKNRYQDYGIEEVEILADADERRCDVCGSLHKKRYNINAHVPIPAHPKCRCCIVPVLKGLDVKQATKDKVKG